MKSFLTEVPAELVSCQANKRENLFPRRLYEIIANDRGHLLPSVPRSKVRSPHPYQKGKSLGFLHGHLANAPKDTTCSGDLDLPHNCCCCLLTKWIQKNPDLLKASNGLRPDILGQPQDPGNQKKCITKTVQQAPNPTIIPSSPVIDGDEPQSSHPSAGHTPGPLTPVNSPNTRSESQ